MGLRKRIRFEDDPAEFIRQAVVKFVEKSPYGRRKIDGGRFYDEPLVGFGAGDDPLFDAYKAIIGPFHLTPRKIFDAAFGESRGPGPLSVISWVLPISEDTRKSNRKEDKFPSLLWSHTRYFGEPFNDRLRKHVVSLLERKGCKAVAPANSPLFARMHAPSGGITSNWSERHAAYVCGLGTFGLCDGFITPKGKAVRLGSVIVDLSLPPSGRPYADHRENCLFYFNGTCKACASRCPGGAITEEGHDKERCFAHMREKISPAKANEYGVKITGCGLCQTKVPCEFEIPKAIQKERAKATKD